MSEELARRLGLVEGQMKGFGTHINNLNTTVKELSNNINRANVLNEGRLTRVETKVESVESTVAVLDKSVKKGYWPLVVTVIVALLAFCTPLAAAWAAGAFK